MIDRYPNKNRYGGDLTFLTEKVWPMLKNNQIGHDSYSCHKFPNSRPFPTKRPDNYQHVGQVFLIEGGRDVARMGDINGFMKGRETPKQCRGRPEWRYGWTFEGNQRHNDTPHHDNADNGSNRRSRITGPRPTQQQARFCKQIKIKEQYSTYKR